MTAETVVTVMASDRVGIIAEVTQAVSELGGNINELSQTVMRGYFTIILSVTFPTDMTHDRIRELIEQKGARGELLVSVKDYVGSAQSALEGDRFILTTRGADQPGIIRQVTGYLAHKSINIEDCYAYVEGDGFVMILEVTIPHEWDVRQLQLDLESLGSEIGLSAHLQHENIFLATNEVRSVRALSGGGHATH